MLKTRLITALLLLTVSTNLFAKVNVRVKGVDGAKLENVLNTLTINNEEKVKDLEADKIEYLHSQAKKEIIQALEPFGYYKINISDSLTKTKEGYNARYNITTNQPIKLAKVNVVVNGDGKYIKDITKLQDEFPLKAGDILLHKAYEDGKANLIAACVANGFLQAKYTKSEILIDTAKYIASINLILETKTQYKFGPVTFNNTKLDQDFLHKFVPFVDGEPYLNKRLIEMQQSLQATNYFSSIDIDAKPKKAKDLQIPIEVNLAERKKNQYTFAIGFGSDTGARGKIGYDRRIANKYGHKFSTNLTLAQINNNIDFNYLIPGKRPANDKILLSAKRLEETIDDRVTDTYYLSSNYITKRSRWERVLALDYQLETFRQASGFSSVNSSLLLPMIKLSYTKKDDLLNLTKGTQFSASLKGAHENLLSTTSFLQANTAFRYVYPLSNISKFIGRIKLGATLAEDNMELPLSIRQFAGGDDSVRGYAYKSLGPSVIDSNGKKAVIGGKHLLVASLEYEHKIWQKISGAVFYDTGNAFNDYTKFRLYSGAGFGLRYHSPIGPIKVDIARALSGSHDNYRLHIRFGPVF